MGERSIRRIALVGAGYISDIHAEAIQRMPGVCLAAVVDPSAKAARGLAERRRIGQVFATVDELVASGEFDCAHVLVPPHLHESVGVRLLDAGKPVFLEKPLATSAAACDALIAASAQSGAVLGVNQNLLYHPAFLRLRAALEDGRVGRPNFISCTYNLPLRQLAAQQFGHWMFDEPANILLEQAVHPLSQIVALAGPIEEVSALRGRPREIRPGLPFYSAVEVSLHGRLPCQFHFAVGQSFPFWQLTVVGDDGVIVADMAGNRMVCHRRSRWLEPVDIAVSGTRTGADLVRESWKNLFGYLGSTVKLRPRSDAFFRGMSGSIAAFHQALDGGSAPKIDGAFGRDLVSLCEKIAAQAMPATPCTRRAVAVKSAAWDVAIIGGTGFIGTHVVERFLRGGARLSVMARNARNLPALFDDERVTVHTGDIGDAEAVGRAIGAAKVVINLAHGGGGNSREEVAERMVGGARTVAQACLARGVRLLVHVGSTASLYLGPQRSRLTGRTPPDPLHELRAEYARAKALTDRMLLDMHQREGLPVCVLRPSVVVGAGASPFHVGFGFYNNEQHCIGWNRGRNALPVVLVEDVAEAVWLATQARDVAGCCYNLVGDIRPSAREFVAMLGRAKQRPLYFHPQSPSRLWLIELGKWAVKRGAGRRVPRPSRRDILSRGMCAEFDCSDAKRDLGWQPVANFDAFYRSAVLSHTA